MTNPIAVIGAGITGLAAAWELQRAGVEVTVLEATDRIGGRIRTTAIQDLPVDEGADAFLARVPEGVQLAEELGLTAQLVSPATKNACVWRRGALYPLPQPNFLGIPLEPGNLKPDALLSAAGIAELVADLDRTEIDPARPGETLGSFIRRRLGDEVFDALVNPLIGSINAGDCDHLSAATVAPQIVAAAQRHASLLQGLRDMRAESDTTSPVFYSFPNGMQVLIDALGEELGSAIRLSRPVTSLDTNRHGLRIETAHESLNPPACILAIPAAAAAHLARRWPAAVKELRSVEYVSVVMATTVYRRDDVPELPADMSGFLCPVGSNTVITACSYTSQKWPYLGEEYVVLRTSLGRYGSDAIINAADDDIMQVVRQDLRHTMGIEAAPVRQRVTRWPRSFPQYTPGHGARVAKIRAELNPSGVFVAGASYDGIGVPACIRQGRARARTVLHYLGLA